MKRDFKGVCVGVVGLGRSGFAAARFLAERGAVVRATDGSDKKEVLENAGYLRAMGVTVETGGHTTGFLAGCETVVTSPGVPKDSAPLREALRRRARVISEIELASYFCKGTVAGVTGSNGKTTTCHLIHRMLTDADKKSALCGNVGFSFLDAVAEIDAKTVAVVELSSFQLEDSPTFRPHVACLLNIARNHLDRHGNMAAYARAKGRLFTNQTSHDWAIVKDGDAWVGKVSKDAKARKLRFGLMPFRRDGVFLSGGAAVLRRAGKVTELFRPETCGLKGAHNVENMMAAALVALTLGVSAKSIASTLRKFHTLEHRIEPLGEIRGVRFVNDSKSTTVDSTKAALEAVDAPVVLLAGGRDKGAAFADIETLVKKKVKRAVLYGEARQKIASAWRGFRAVDLEPDFRAAVGAALAAAQAGDTVLLSPMCTSFDQFHSYEHRGETFKKIFRELASAREVSWPHHRK